MKDRQVVGRHGQDDDGDRGLIHGADILIVPVWPGAVAALIDKELRLYLVVPLLPLFTADLVHGMGGVIVTVPEVLVRLEIVLQVSDRLRNFLGLILAAELQDADAGR